MSRHFIQAKGDQLYGDTVFQPNPAFAQDIYNVLSNAYAVIEDDLHWCHGCSAMDEYGDKCWWTDPQADMFSAAAAISLVCRNGKVKDNIKFMVFNHLNIINGNFISIIEAQGHEATLAAFRKAMEACHVG